MRLFDNPLSKSSTKLFDYAGDNGNLLVQHKNTSEDRAASIQNGNEVSNIILEADHFVKCALESNSPNEKPCVLVNNNIKLSLETNKFTGAMSATRFIRKSDSSSNDCKSLERYTLEDESGKNLLFYSPSLSPQENIITRGIINPNYPGFQKFAHTLAEPFIAYSQSEYYYDSDTSDQDGPTDDSKIIDVNLNNTSSNSISIHKRTPYPIFNDSSNRSDINFNPIGAYNNSSTTPDLLLKNTKKALKTNYVNHPDLLHNVDLCAPKENHENWNNIINNEPGFNKAEFKSTKDDILQSLTPVDIIGDFGKEVEREFGLLVKGYNKLENSENSIFEVKNKLEDAQLSDATDIICNTKHSCNNFCGQPHSDEESHDIKHTEDSKINDCYSSCSNTEGKDVTTNVNRSNNSNVIKFQKHSHDDRQLPPVVIEYKLCQQNQRNSKKSHNNDQKISRFSNNDRINPVKRNNHTVKSTIQTSKHCKRNEDDEINEYQDILSNKELIIRNSRYIKLSSWAQYLESTVGGGGENSNGAVNIISPRTLELFDAYRIGSDIDKDTLKTHIKKAKEIEKKRRSERDEIRRRLAMEDKTSKSTSNSNISSQNFEEMNPFYNDNASDGDSHSSDSETCPKLSKGGTNNNPIQQIKYHYCKKENKNVKDEHRSVQNIENKGDHQLDDDIMQEACDFYTKQSKFQLEARMALGQTKKVAEMQMQTERKQRITSPITEIIRNALTDVGVHMGSNKRRVSRQMLTCMNVSQLRGVVNELQIHIETLNSSLVNYLFQRDDLQTLQDAILVEIEEISKFMQVFKL